MYMRDLYILLLNLAIKIQLSYLLSWEFKGQEKKMLWFYNYYGFGSSCFTDLATKKIHEFTFNYAMFLSYYQSINHHGNLAHM